MVLYTIPIFFIRRHVIERLPFMCIIEKGKIIYEKSSEELEMECVQKNISLEQLYFQITGDDCDV